MNHGRMKGVIPLISVELNERLWVRHCLNLYLRNYVVAVSSAPLAEELGDLLIVDVLFNV